MILKLRIDDRLLHGQVAYSWKSILGYNAIVIADDVAANDDMRKTTIRLCCPDGVKLATRTIENAASLLNNPKLKKMKVFVICANPQSAYELLTKIDEKPIVNIGGMQSSSGKILFSKAVYVNQIDIQYMDKIKNAGYQIEVQEVPSTTKHDYDSLRNKISFE